MATSASDERSPGSRADAELVSRRERILDAAVEEFGANGYSGARTATIAARAGVSSQLISYYFGGKQGLLEALRERWAQTEAELVPAGASFAEAVGAYAEATLENANWARLVGWQALGDGPGDDDARGQARATRISESLVRTRARQRDGELRDDLDPELLLLLGHLLAFAPVLMPQFVADIFGEDAPWIAYRRTLAEQLAVLVEARR